MAEGQKYRRRFPRYRTSLDVMIRHGSESVRARITQISRAGCLIFPPLPPQRDREVSLSFRLSNDLPDISCKGEILYRTKGKETGVAFTEISLHNQALITQHFEKHLGAEKSGPDKVAPK